MAPGRMSRQRVRMADERPAASPEGTAHRAGHGRAGVWRARAAGATAIVVYIALAKLALHLLTAGGYGFFRDEFYFMDAGRRLAWGYVDFPPLVAGLAALVPRVLGASMLAWRLLPAVAGALLVFLTGLMARELGAGALGQAVAALCSLFAINFLVVDSFFSMNPFDELWWVLLAYLLIRLLRRDEPRLWLAAGAVAGIGLLTKESMFFLGAALAAALLAAGPRRHLRTPWPWLGALLAFAIGLPYLVWNAAHGWPTVEFWQGYRADLLAPGPMPYLLQQIQAMNPMTLPIWLMGLGWYLFAGQGRPYRMLGLTYLFLLALFAAAHVKPYFLAPAYPILYAAGGRLGETLRLRGLLRWLPSFYLAELLFTGAVLVPLGVPLLPPAVTARTYAPLLANPALQVEEYQPLLLPQWLAGRFGWPELAGQVAGVYRSLPPAEQAQACILAGNYGQAGALNYYRGAYGLPPAISGHDNYYLWGPGSCSGEVLIAVGVPAELLARHYGEVVRAGATACAYCLPEENGVPLYIARRPRQPIRQWWGEVKRYGM